MHNSGPFYCETNQPWLFMAEPINTISNLVIISFVTWAFLKIRKEGFPLDLSALTLLLFLTGVGSLFWHATRTSIALTFDVLPGLLFFLLFTYLWARKLYGILFGFLGLISFILLIFGVSRIEIPLSTPFFLPVFLSVLIFGLFLTYLTKRKFGGKLALGGIIVLSLALVAAFFRTLDIYICDLIPFGTHFLWHTFLPAAAYSGIVFFIKIDRVNNQNV